MTAPVPRRRRTWPQRLLILTGLALSVVLFVAARFFWEARTVLAELPRISVGPGVLEQAGAPGEPVNFLLVGVDSSAGLDPDDPVRQGRNVEDEARGVVRPDTILILRLDPATGRAAVLSLPRDLIVEAPGGTMTRINATQAVGGVEALINTIDSNFAVRINHFVVADFAGFAELVELVGGVPINFPYPTRDLGSGLFVDAGCWSLNGRESLAYVRSRSIEENIDGEWVELVATAPDLARIERQQEFMVLALEQVLNEARSDISRIGDFIDTGSQAVQLDQALTPGTMLDLASAFADYDTEALAVETIPVSPSFSEDGRYLGEAVVVEEAAELLRVFQGQADGVRPALVEVAVVSSDDRHRNELGERGFVASDGGSVESGPTTVRFAPDLRDEALLLTRYLEGVPRLVVEADSPLRLEVGPDFSGVREFPRPLRDIEPGLDAELRRYAQENPTPTTAAPQTTSTAAPDALEEPSPTTESASVTSIAPEATTVVPSTLSVERADEPNGPATTGPSTPTLVVRGRPPADAVCGPTGG